MRLTTFCAPPSTAAPPCSDVSGDQEDISFVASISDVQCGGTAPFCSAANADYTGSVIYNLPIRLTDHSSGPGPGAPPPCANGTGPPPCLTGTVVDANLGLVVGCVPVGAAGTPPGSTCSVSTTVDTVAPGTIAELQRASFRFFDELQVRDLGPDGSAGGGCPVFCGTGDEGITRAQGVFAP